MIANLGRVLIAMADYAGRRADLRRDYLGKENTELLWAIRHMLGTGAAKCLQIAREDAADRELVTAGSVSNDAASFRRDASTTAPAIGYAHGTIMPIVSNYADAEDAFRNSIAVIVLCLNGDRHRFCVSAAEAQEFYTEKKVMA